MMDEATSIFTIGHSTRTLDEFTHLLEMTEVTLLVDVRTIPRSRTNPQYNQDTFPQALAERGFGYEHLLALGGRRGKSKEIAPDVNAFWMNQSFHNYADYALTDEFRAGLDRLRVLGREQRCAIMCSEAVWWRCHRRIITDYLLAFGEDVFHIMGDQHVDPATLTPTVVWHADGTLTYPPAAA